MFYYRYTQRLLRIFGCLLKPFVCVCVWIVSRICVLLFTMFLLFVLCFVLFGLCIFILICFVCTIVRTMPPSDNSIAVNNNNNNNNNNNRSAEIEGARMITTIEFVRWHQIFAGPQLGTRLHINPSGCYNFEMAPRFLENTCICRFGHFHFRVMLLTKEPGLIFSMTLKLLCVSC